MTEKKTASSDVFAGLNKVLGGVSELVGKLGEIAEQGETLKRDGTFEDKDIKGVFGYSVHVGTDGIKAKVEPFGNIKTDKETGESVVNESREPVVDICFEGDNQIIEAEVPGVRADDVVIEVEASLLVFTAERGERKYRKEIELAKPYLRENMVVSCNSGILRIKCIADAMDENESL